MSVMLGEAFIQDPFPHSSSYWEKFVSETLSSYLVIRNCNLSDAVCTVNESRMIPYKQMANITHS